MRPYLAILSARFRLLLQYRAAAVAGFACQLFWGLIRMMIFQAFYENAPASVPMAQQDVVSYVWLGQAFILLTLIGTDGELQDMIQRGTVGYELLRPVDLHTMWFCRALAGRVAPMTLRAAPMLALATLAGWLRWPAWPSLLAFAVSLAAAAFLAAAMSTLMNLTMFWTLSGRGISAVTVTLVFILSGMILPLPLFPEAVQGALNFLPFRGLCDVPFRLFTGHIPAAEAPAAILHQLAWTAGLILIGRGVFRRARARLVIQGG